jgi:hypothetical protein
MVMGCMSLPAIADEGRVPIYKPTVITEPGTYFLTRDIVHTDETSNSWLITIAASPVVLDLNGHALRGRVPESYNDINLIHLSGGLVTIMNGRLTGVVGATIDGTASKLILRNLVIDSVASNTSISVATPFIEMTSCSVSCVFACLTGAQSGNIENSQFYGGDSTLPLSSFNHGRFRNNQVYGGGAPVCATLGESNRVDGNTFSGCMIGLTVAGGSVITNNIIEGRLSLLGPASRAEGNRVTFGLRIESEENVVVNNYISAGNLGGTPAVSISTSNNVLEGNTLRGFGCGISFDGGTGNVYRNNFIYSGLPLCGSTTTQVDAGGNVY